MSEAASDRPSLLEYVQVPLRRPWHVAIPFVVVTLLAVGLSLLIAKSYTSSTLILVESAKVPESFLNEGAARDSAAARPRLQTIRQEILSRTRLERILEELNPYPDRSGRAPLTSIVESMRGNIAINVKGNDSFSDRVHAPRSQDGAGRDRAPGLAVHRGEQPGAQDPGGGDGRVHRVAAARRPAPARGEGEGAAAVQGVAHGPAAGADRRQPRDPAAAAARAAVGERQPALGTRAGAADRARRVGGRRRARQQRPGRRAGDRAQRAREPARPLHGRAPRRAVPAGPRHPAGAAGGAARHLPQGDVQLEQARAELRHLEGKLGGRGPPHRDLPGPCRGHAAHRAGAGDAHARLRAAQPGVPGPAQEEDGRADGREAREQVEDGQLPHPRPGLSARAAGVAEPLALPLGGDGPGPAGRPGSVARRRDARPHAQEPARGRGAPALPGAGDAAPARRDRSGARHGWHRSEAIGPDAAAAPPRASRRADRHGRDVRSQGAPEDDGAPAQERRLRRRRAAASTSSSRRPPRTRARLSRCGSRSRRAVPAARWPP